MTRHTKYRCLQISLVASQINECNHFGRFLANLYPIQCAVVWFIHHMTYTVKAYINKNNTI